MRKILTVSLLLLVIAMNVTAQSNTFCIAKGGKTATIVVDEQDWKVIGSLLVMEFENREQLDEYLAHEPYVVEHVWERIEVERMNVVIFDREIIRERI